MNIERDKFLAEVMGECWHGKVKERDVWNHRCNCGYGTDSSIDFAKHLIWQNDNFSTWEGFGKLIVWCQTNKWWIMDFMPLYDKYTYMHLTLNPDRFTNAVYKFLKEK